MPSMFEFAKRMIKGEPVYQAQDAAKNQAPASQSTRSSRYESKSIPQVMVVREECAINGNRMTCSADIQNASDQPAFLDEIHIFGMKHELQYELDPGERREFIIYRGSTITRSYVNDCSILYRDQTGDYFKSLHDVDCIQQPDGTQELKRIRFLPPIRDV